MASLAFLFSSLVDNAIGPIIGTMAMIIVFYVISDIPVELFTAVKPYLFTTYLNVWQKALEQPIDWSGARDLGGRPGRVQHWLFTLAWYIFVRKDILS